ncbi:siderophore ABC transporter substrate-binding protein [Xenorhabdus griffiniae]|uniref:Siderophore ABC transporter substrate-binding protein n=1 Tax=Xenorhabdus griffiniae TaxID=351672 RepID=A0ABY9XEQ1_9GAMM|nr:siderophore ABC transporter substrate-binding protein [Xenorhabdus griffiniae]MBD1226042.1 siderophore ABC transporter substrate-binding protein [Xenorhabdus griffiniae]MBE8585840.1 siderophore ABC transporter substrate-binding protein [Xenorhabdus griffiniae]WMV71388.1 siderophore ABC transporter substrate-binding protein [Xenorhabdus griffiniae]WNH01064.1 siderophore ABC transporter substrate-binding protein [Xenorhabdus griffiniae]
MKKILPIVIASLLSATSYSAFSQSPELIMPNSVTAQSGDYVTVKHLSGETQVKKNPKRVVLFDFGTYDSLVKLGLSDRVIALPINNLPEYVRNGVPATMHNAGGMKEPNLEKLAEIKPDLIVITGRQGAFYDRLSQIAPTINLSTDNENYLSSVDSNLKLLGELFNKQDIVKTQFADLEKTLAAAQVRAQAENSKVLVLLHNAGELYPNNQAIVYNVIKAPRAILPAKSDKDKSRSVTADMIAQANPDVIFIIDRSEAIGAGKLEKAQFENDQVKSTNAYKNGKIVYLQPDLWYLSGGGLDSMTRQINAVADAL